MEVNIKARRGIQRVKKEIHKRTSVSGTRLRQKNKDGS